MDEKRFYVTIEVTAWITEDVSNSELYRKILQYIHNENQKGNSPYGHCYLHGENILSIYDEKGKQL